MRAIGRGEGLKVQGMMLYQCEDALNETLSSSLTMISVQWLTQHSKSKTLYDSELSRFLLKIQIKI